MICAGAICLLLKDRRVFELFTRVVITVRYACIYIALFQLFYDCNKHRDYQSSNNFSPNVQNYNISK